ncbi:ATP-binding protein [Metabacillus fastidiosus]|uniref:ATP-binding protein n=2 Tax=Metabacillus fastidiosus TaxID=1458 RepID=UPI002E1FCFF0|nr:ATP-binding protein [Metabacillus fastidiosus]MED4461829.1 ATP-binding protein [Metabacillus fastidiosus]
MQSFREVLKKGKSTITDSSVTNEYTCKGCGSRVKEFTTVIALGPMAGEKVTSKIGCNCKLYEQIKQEQKEADKTRMKRIFDDNSLINESLKKANFKNFEKDRFPAAYKTAADYVRNFDLADPANLFFQGPFGTGKSHLSVSISKALVALGYSSVFISLPKLYTKIRSTYNKDSEMTEDQLMQALFKVDLLVLDDIGAEGETKGWSIGKAFEIIDQRSGKHNIYTTNLSSDDFESSRDTA